MDKRRAEKLSNPTCGYSLIVEQRMRDKWYCGEEKRKKLLVALALCLCLQPLRRLAPN